MGILPFQVPKQFQTLLIFVVLVRGYQKSSHASSILGSWIFRVYLGWPLRFEVVESIALNRVSSALRAVMQLQAVHTVHMVDGKALPVSELQLDPILHLQFFV